MLRLPNRTEEVLLLVYGEGLKEVEVAERLGVSRQAVSKALREGRAKLTEMFITIAELLNADLVRVELRKGAAVMRNRQTGSRIYILYVPGIGPRALIGEEIECGGANSRLCAELVAAAKAWKIIEECSASNISRCVNDIVNALES